MQISIFQLLTAITAVLLLAGCKIRIEVPAGGKVSTLSGNILCSANQPCEIDVNDTSFTETFVAEADTGYLFTGWKKRPRGFCGGSAAACALSTADFVGNASLMNFLSSNEVFYLEPVFRPNTTSIAPGRFTSTVHYSYVFSDQARDRNGKAITLGYETRMYNPSCSPRFTNAILDVSNGQVSVETDSADGEAYYFTIDPDLGLEQRLSGSSLQLPDLIAILRGENEFLELDLRWDDGTRCHTSLHLDRQNGEIIPPTARFSFAGCNSTENGENETLVCGTDFGGDLKEAGFVDDDEPKGFQFKLEDKDGWITSAELKWKQEGGGSGVIDLLAESSDLKHHVNYYRWGKNASGQYIDYWHGGYRSDADSFLVKYVLASGYDYYKYNSNNFNELFGAGVFRDLVNVEKVGDGIRNLLYGDMRLELTVTDNDGKSYRRIFEVKTRDDNLQAPASRHYLLIQPDESLYGEQCADYLITEKGLDQARREGINLVEGPCPGNVRTNTVCEISQSMAVVVYGPEILGSRIYLPDELPNPEEVCTGTIVSG